MSSKKKMSKRAGVAGVAALAVAAGGLGLSAYAAESGPSFAPYDEKDSPNPVAVTGGLAYYKGADMGWVVNAPIEELESLSYTVTDSTSFAPSYQLVTFADRPAKDTSKPDVTHAYTRLAWEPYQQVGNLDPNNGVYTNLEDGVWWTNQILSGPGSQDSPQPLEFFTKAVADGGAGWTNVVVGAVDVKQGTTTDATSVVTSVTYNGQEVQVGNDDLTTFDQDDIDAAIAPVQADLDAANLAVEDLQAQLETAQSDLTDYTANHSNANGTNIGVTSQVALKSNPMVGKSVGVNVKGTIANSDTVKYQWLVSGKSVKGATKSTFTVPASAKGKTVTVRVTGESKDIVFGVVSNGIVAK